MIDHIGNSFYMGVDLGQSNDYTAIAIVEHVGRMQEDDRMYEHAWHLRHCERMPLHTPYTEVATHFKRMINKLENEDGRVILIVDSTGVGRPVTDALKEHGLKPIAVTVTSGHKVVVDGTEYHIPKRDLVSAAKMMLGKRQLKIAQDMSFADVLVNELLSYSVKINTATGHNTYASWRENEHDDLVFALCLSCWFALKKKDFGRFEGVARDTSEKFVHPDHYYRIGWVPAKGDDCGALVVYNFDSNSLVSFERLKNEAVQDQITRVFLTAQHYDTAVWSAEGVDEAMLNALQQRGGYVQRVAADKLTESYENLMLLIKYKAISLPNNPGLLADVEAENNSLVTALCLVTFDVLPTDPKNKRDNDRGLGNYYFDEFEGRWISRLW